MVQLELSGFHCRWSGWGLTALLLSMNPAVARVPTTGYALDSVVYPSGVSSEDDAHWWDGFGKLGMDYWVDVLTGYGNDLIAGGSFFTAGGVRAIVIARWDGTTWSALGGGLNTEDLPGPEYTPWVRTLTVYNGNLIAGGNFTKADGRPANYIASWNGTSWSPLGSGMNHRVFALAVYGGELVAGGDFTQAGSQTVNYIARWDGTSWRPLGSGFDQPVDELVVHRGSLIAAGTFTHSGTTPIAHIARWDGVSWTDPGGPSNIFSNVRDFAVYDSVLVVGGELYLNQNDTRRPGLRWDGTTWSPLGGNLTGVIYGLGIYNNDLVAAGVLWIGGVWANYIARWDGTSWRPFGSGLNDGGGAFLEHNSSLFVGGAFTSAGGKPSKYIARWDDRITPIEVANLTAAATQGGVQLRWELSGEARDELLGVHVQRAETSLGPYVPVTRSPLDPALSMEFLDSDVKVGRYWYRLVLLPARGQEKIAGPIAVSVIEPRWQTRLYPPFTPDGGGSIEIRYSLGRSGMPMRLDVFDVTGRFLRSLDQGIHSPGEYAHLWNRRDEQGAPVARGVYLVRLIVGDAHLSRKLVLLHE